MTEQKKVSILGTEYGIIVKKYDEEEAFGRRGIDGFCDGYAKEIVMCDMTTYKGWEHEEPKTIVPYSKVQLRHEIVHAFFFESGLAQSSSGAEDWAMNEEMVDWFARQGPKIYGAWKEAGCL